MNFSMDYLFESLTVYLMIGLALGVAGFLFLWRKWDLPGYLKTRFRLDTRVKNILFLVVFGMLLAFCLAMLMDVAGLPLPVAQFLEGLGIGFNCSLIPGLLREYRAGRYSASPTSSRNTNKRAEDNRSRRSKG